MPTLANISSLIAPRNNSRRIALAAAPLIAALGLLTPAAFAQTTYINASTNNGSFETPTVSTLSYQPASASFTFSSQAGIARPSASPSASINVTGGAQNGAQYGFLQISASALTSTISQSFTLLTAQNVSVSFYVAGRNGGAGGATNFSAAVTGPGVTDQIYSGATADGQAFTAESGIAPNLAAGTYTLTFTASEIGGSTADNTAAVDNVIVTGTASAPEPSALLLLAPGALGMVGTIARRKRAA